MSRRSWLYPQLWSGCVGAWLPSSQRWPSATLVDYSGRNNNGTLTSMDAASDFIPYNSSVSVDCDGVSDYVDIPIGRSTDVYTIHAWIKPRGYGENNLGRIWETTSAKLFTSANDPHIAFTNDGSTILGSGTSFTLTSLIHVCAVSYGTTGAIFVNGSQVSSGSIGTLSTSTTMQIGGRPSGGRSFDGNIFELAMYDKALSSNTIRMLSNKIGMLTATKKTRAIGASSTLMSGSLIGPGRLTGGGLLVGPGRLIRS